MIRLFVAGDVRVYCEQLGSALNGDGRVEVVGVAANAEDLIRSVGDTGPEVVLLDVRMPDAFRTIREVRVAFPEIHVIGLGVSESAEDVLALAETGVAGWVARDCSLDDLVERVEGTVAGELHCSGRIAAALLDRLAGRVSPENGAEERLTAREVEVLRLLDEGLSNKSIAGRLIISVATVKNHVHNVLEKLGAHSRGEAVRRARQLDLLRSSPAVELSGGNYERGSSHTSPYEVRASMPTRRVCRPTRSRP